MTTTWSYVAGGVTPESEHGFGADAASPAPAVTPRAVMTVAATMHAPRTIDRRLLMLPPLPLRAIPRPRVANPARMSSRRSGRQAGVHDREEPVAQPGNASEKRRCHSEERPAAARQTQPPQLGDVGYRADPAMLVGVHAPRPPPGAAARPPV